MSLKALSSVVLVALLVFSCSIVKATDVQLVLVSDDTYIVDYDTYSNFGRELYLKVADSTAELSLAFLMFNLSGISYAFNASSEIKLKLRCYNVTLPQFIGVHWCLNNTWNEENLTFDSIHDFETSDYAESIVNISNNNWYEWIVTDFVRNAMQQHFDRLTLVLQAEVGSDEDDYVFFYSKDYNLQGVCPQLVFSYKSSATGSLDATPIVILVSIVVAVVGIIAYGFSRKRKREKYHRILRFQQKSVKRTK